MADPEEEAERSRQRPGDLELEGVAGLRTRGLHAVRSGEYQPAALALPTELLPRSHSGHRPGGGPLAGLLDPRLAADSERAVVEPRYGLHGGGTGRPALDVGVELPDPFGWRVHHEGVGPSHDRYCTIWYMVGEVGAREQLLERVMAFAAAEGIAGKSLREIARGAATSHRMLLYHFGSREGLLAAIVAAIEAQQRAVMVAMAEHARTPRELMIGLWEQVSQEELRPFVKLFFEVFGLVAQGAPGTEGLRETLTQPWLTDAAEVAKVIGVVSDPAELRLGVAVSRGLLLDLVAGADYAQVDEAYRRFVDLYERATESSAPRSDDGQVSGRVAPK